MPVRSLVIEFFGRRPAGPDATADEVVTPLALRPGEVEAAGSWGPGSVRVSSARFAPPPGADPAVTGIPDDEFDAWAADAFRAAVRFLDGRPEGVFPALTATGLDLEVVVEVHATGDFPVVDWPPELYDACRRHGVGLSSVWPDDP